MRVFDVAFGINSIRPWINILNDVYIWSFKNESWDPIFIALQFLMDCWQQIWTCSQLYIPFASNTCIDIQCVHYHNLLRHIKKFYQRVHMSCSGKWCHSNHIFIFKMLFISTNALLSMGYPIVGFMQVEFLG